MTTIDPNLTAKFGPAPLLVPPHVPPHAVLLGQFVVCAAVLLIVQPSFVWYRANTPCPLRVCSASLSAVVATWVMHRCGAQPADAFRGAFGLLSHAMR
jgi:hypothetical protein